MAEAWQKPIEAGEPSWVRRYFDGLAFFFWEPQHLGRQKNSDGRLQGAQQVLDHLKRIEPTLNHALNQFYSIAPLRFRRELFETVFQRPFEADLFFHGGGVETEHKLPSSVQPDLFFTSPTSVVSIEMKIDAKTSCEQVLKYCLLGLGHERKAGAEKRHFLMLLARASSRSVWKEGYKDMSAAKKAIAGSDLDSFVSKHPAWVSKGLPRFRQIVEDIELQLFSYPELSAVLQEKLPPPADASPGAEVLRRLIGGIRDELKDRGLT